MSSNLMDSGKTFQVEFWGQFACFSRPEMKTERVSYDVMTPSAARGAVESIYWHPSITYAIDRIHILNPIRTMNIRRNETKSVINARNVRQEMQAGTAKGFIATSKNIAQRASLLLRDVRYVVEGRILLDPRQMQAGDNAEKFHSILTRRIQRGQCYHQPCFGCREFPAHFREPDMSAVTCTADLKGDIDLGYMLWDMDFTDVQQPRPMFFRAHVKDGVLDVPGRDSEAILT